MRPRSSFRRVAGYTVVEVFMSISVLTVGAMGVIALQKATAVANANARALNVADEIATGWVERLRTDALLWNHPSSANPASDLSDTVFLNAPSTDWIRPSPVAGPPVMSARADALGRDLPDPPSSGDPPDPPTQFCTHLRVAPVFPNVLRAEIRVFWRRDNVAVAGSEDLCDETPAQVDAAPDNYHFLYVTTSVYQNTPP